MTTDVATTQTLRHAIGVDAMPAFVIGRELQLHVTATALLAAS